MTMTGKPSPWGLIDYSKPVANGVWFVSTPGHGGYKLDAIRNRQVHSDLRQPGGWYEEDCEWATVCLTFPDLFTPALVDIARGYAARWTPKAIEVFGLEPVVFS